MLNNLVTAHSKLFGPKTGFACGSLLPVTVRSCVNERSQIFDSATTQSAKNFKSIPKKV